MHRLGPPPYSWSSTESRIYLFPPGVSSHIPDYVASQTIAGET